MRTRRRKLEEEGEEFKATSTPTSTANCSDKMRDEFNTVVVKEEIKEELDEDLTPTPSAAETSQKMKRIKVRVIKRKDESAPPSLNYAKQKCKEYRKEYHRKRRAAMTPEQRQKERERAVRYRRIKREEKIRAEEEEYNAMKRDRSLKRYMKLLTPEELEKSQWRIRTEAARLKGPEELAREETLAIKRMSTILWIRRKWEESTPEQLEEWKKRTLELNRARSRRYKMRKKMLKPKKEEQERKKAGRPKRQDMSEEARAEERRKRREWIRNRSEEAKERERFQKYTSNLMRLAAMTDEERRAWTEKNTEVARKWRESLTGEKLEKFREYNRSKVRERFRNMTREEYAAHLRKVREYQNQRVANNTPEERLKRLKKYKVNAAVRKLKKRLGEEGATQEEISKQVEELKRRMWEEPLPPPETLSTYKPRPRRNRKYGDLDIGDATTCVPKRPKGRPPGLSGPRTQNKMGLLVKQTDNVNESKAAGDKELAVNLEADTTVIPKRRRGRPPGPSRRQIRTEPDLPVKCPDAVKKSGAVDDNDGGGLEHFDFESFGDSLSFHENVSNSASMPTPTTDVQEEDEVEQLNPTPILQFDLKCPHCPFIHSERSELLHHLSSEHPSNCWKCPLCKSIMLSPAELQEHFKSEHSNTTSVASSSASQRRTSESGSFRCVKCSVSDDSVFGSHRDLMEHVKSSHPESYWPCPNCNILKYSEKGLSIHKKLCKGSKAPRSKMNARFSTTTTAMETDITKHKREQLRKHRSASRLPRKK